MNIPQPENQLTLSEAEKSSPLYIRLKQYYEKRLDQLRKQNDTETLSPEKTLVLRGQIKECKNFLALEKSPLQFEGAPPQ